MMKRIRVKDLFRKLLLCLLVAVLLLPAASGSEVLAAVKPYTYYRSHLSGVDRTAYNAIIKAAEKGKKTTASFSGNYYAMNESVPFMLQFDHPEYFWLGKEASVTSSYNPYTGAEYLTFDLAESWSGAYKQRAAFNRKVNSIVKSLKKKAKGKSAYYKARLIRDYICKNCSYKQCVYDQSAYGVFMRKKAVCAGYAKAYKLLCDRLDIPCICVEAVVAEYGAPHLLNFVRIKKKWYYVDCTWEDNPSGRPYNRYFLLGKTTARCRIKKSLGIKVPALTKNDVNPRRYL